MTDTGIGIAQEHLSTLFADFVQIDTRLQRRLRGTGLGLSLARKFAELLGGRVGLRVNLAWARVSGSSSQCTIKPYESDTARRD